MGNKRKSYELQGNVIKITEKVKIERKEGNSFEKRTVGVQTLEKQVVFFESRIDLDRELEAGDNVTVEYYFAGSIKADKIYNNVIASKITVND